MSVSKGGAATQITKATQCILYTSASIKNYMLYNFKHDMKGFYVDCVKQAISRCTAVLYCSIIEELYESKTLKEFILDGLVVISYAQNAKNIRTISRAALQRSPKRSFKDWTHQCSARPSTISKRHGAPSRGNVPSAVVLSVPFKRN